jgi:hypothetical protein
MASTTTGQMYSQEQFDAMSVSKRASLGLVQITPTDQAILEPMSLDERKAWLKEHKSKKPSRRSLNKRERQNKKLARMRR